MRHETFPSRHGDENVYAHILDEDRKINAEILEAAFYSPENRVTDVNQLLKMFRKNPE